VKFYEVKSDDCVETRRTDKSTAEQDAYILRWLGKRGVTIEEVSDDNRVQALA
jgi:hypothetical protein